MTGINNFLSAIIILFVCLFNVQVNAANINAASCSLADVQNAIDSASVGDVVIVPEGSCTWTTSMVITKAITLRGGGSYSVNDNHDDTGIWPVTITFSSLPDYRSGIEINGKSGDFIRITGFHFTGDVLGGTSGHGAIMVDEANEAEWRVDNCRFAVDGNSVVSRSSGLGGLVDHIYVYNPGCNSAGAVLAMDKRGHYTGNWAFTQPVGYGSSNFLFVEDATFWKNCTSASPATAAIDAQAGGKFVFRHNYVRDAMVVWHGTESGAPERGGYAFELYDNEFYWSYLDNRYHCAIFNRGGTSLVYNNKATNYQALWKTWVRRANQPEGIFGQCDGSQDHDGNYGGSLPPGYPCLDQVGRGQTSGASLSDTQPQEESKCYIWNNTLVNTSAVFHNNPSYVVEGRDYEISSDESAKPDWYTQYPYPHPFQSRITSADDADNDETSLQIANYSLSQNYPNPLNPVTTIRFEIPETNEVTLKIYDMAGREVETLVNEIKNAGRYEVKFDAAHLSSAVYFYKLQAGSFSQVKKLILMK